MRQALRSSAAHVFVDSLAAPQLTEEDQHHLLRVLRLRDGEPVTVSDGRGSWRACVVAGSSVVPTSAVEVEPVPPVCEVITAIPKGDRVDWLVQKLTEIGATRIVFLHCDRSVVRWSGDRGRRQLARMMRIARDASMQSRRVHLPLVEGPVEFAAAVAAADPASTVVAEPDGGAPGMFRSVLVGPEGGFSPAELEVAAAHSLRTVSLSDQVLRVETAGLVAAVRAILNT